MEKNMHSRGSKPTRAARISQVAAIALLATLMTGVTNGASSAVVTPAKFEPAAGLVYTGAGQSTEAIVQMINSGDQNRKPMLVAAYDFLNPATINPNVYQPREEIMQAHNFYPGSKLQVGMELPKSNPTELAAVGSGKYDNWIKGMANSYKNLNQDVFLRVGYEFDGAWNAYDPIPYIAAYRHLVDVFRAEGVTNVAFVWNSYTPQADSTDPLATGYRYGGNTLMSWYPGDGYVDWFSFNDWRQGFDSSWFMAQAAAHGKPVLMGENGFTKHLDTGYTFDQWVGPHFASVRSSGAKGFQYINWNWPIYPISDWALWADGKYTKTPSYVTAYNAEMTNSSYIVRDSTYYNPMALWVGAARALPSSSTSVAWAKSGDESSAKTGYDYAPVSATSSYGDGWGTYWSNATGTSQLTVNVTVPSGSTGLLVLGGYASYLGHDVYIGTRKALSGVVPTGPVKIPFTAADSSTGTLAVKILQPDTSSIHIDSIGVQTVSSSAPVAPSGVAVSSATPSSVSLSWTAVAGATVYNVYRNGQLVGTSPVASFTDSNLPFGRSYNYAVSAVDSKAGEGFPSSTVPARTAGTLIDPLNGFSLTDGRASNVTLDTTLPTNFGGDASRLVRTNRNDGWISYRADGLKSVSFVLYYKSGANNVYANVASSSAGPYSNIVLSASSATALPNGWYKATYSGTVPAGNNVIGIHLRGGTTRTYSNQQIGQVSLTN